MVQLQAKQRKSRRACVSGQWYVLLSCSFVVFATAIPVLISVLFLSCLVAPVMNPQSAVGVGKQEFTAVVGNSRGTPNLAPKGRGLVSPVTLILRILFISITMSLINKFS